jgi:hypothetical protein
MEKRHIIGVSPKGTPCAAEGCDRAAGYVLTDYVHVCWEHLTEWANTSELPRIQNLETP